METTPVGGPPNQPNYLNAAGLIRTTLAPEPLLDVLLRIEWEAGRVRRVVWGPRTLDLDILLFGKREITTPRLTIPHPRMTERLFVLEPATEIAPEMIHSPTGLTMRQLLERAKR